VLDLIRPNIVFDVETVLLIAASSAVAAAMLPVLAVLIVVLAIANSPFNRPRAELALSMPLPIPSSVWLLFAAN
jgi:hypothetical protein